MLYDCITLRLLSQIDAHKSPVAAVQFNRCDQFYLHIYWHIFLLKRLTVQ